MKQYKNAGAFMLDVDRLVAVSEDGLGSVSDARLRDKMAERRAAPAARRRSSSRIWRTCGSKKRASSARTAS